MAFRLQSLEDVKIIAESVGFTDIAEVQFLSDTFTKFRNRNAIVCMPGQEPFMINSLDFTLACFELPPIFGDDSELLSTGLSSTSTADESEFLESIEKEPFLPVVQRRAYLGWDDKKFRNVVNSLLTRKAVERMKVKLGRGSPRILFQRSGQIPSIKHEFYVHWIIESLSSKGLVLRKNKVGPDIEIPML